MINLYKDLITIVPSNKVIFAPNSSGKTLFAESFINMSQDDYQVISKDNIEKIIKKATRLESNLKTEKSSNDTLNLNLKLGKNVKPHLTTENVDYLNDFFSGCGIRIINTGNLIEIQDVIIKKGLKSFSLGKEGISTLKTKIGISSSEYEIIIISILMFGFSNTEKGIILDDPIEMASWENEEKFCELFSNLKGTSRKILLTHRLSLFTRLIGKNKELKRKIGKHTFENDYYYFMDGIPYLINKDETNALNAIAINNIKGNKIIERMTREKIRFFLTHESLPTTQNLENFKIENSQAINDIGELKSGISEPNFDNFINLNLFEAISLKIICFTVIRNYFIELINNKNNAKREKLSEITEIELQSFERKKFNKLEYQRIKRTLNALNHHSDWELFNEINLLSFINEFTANFKNIGKLNTFLNLIKSTHHNTIEKIQTKLVIPERILFNIVSCLEKTMKFDKATWSTPELFFAGRKRMLVNYGMAYDVPELTGEFHEYNESGGGQIEYKDIEEAILELIK